MNQYGSILILGGGYIGTYLAEQFTKWNIPFTQKTSKDVNYFDRYELQKILKDHDLIINCVGYTGKPNVDACEDDKKSCYKYNVEMPSILAKTIEQLGKTLIQIGT